MYPREYAEPDGGVPYKTVIRKSTVLDDCFAIAGYVDGIEFGNVFIRRGALVSWFGEEAVKRLESGEGVPD